MSNKPVTIPNTFASATSAIPLSQLDADFTSLANVTNDLITYSNYVADTGVADAYIANFASGINTSSLTAGLLVQFKAGNANTGTSTLAVKVNGTAVGTATIKYADGTNLAAGAIAAGAIVTVQYDGTNFQLMNDPAGKSGGDVTGPSSATNNGIALFDGTTGKLIKDSASSDGLIYGITVGRGGGNVASNTALGYAALATNSSGTYSNAFGRAALYSQTSATDNNAFGFGALNLATTGSYNSAFGTASLGATTTGNNNTAYGYGSLQSNTTASNNTAVGYQAGYSNTTGTELTAVGLKSLYSNSTGNGNSGLGLFSLYANTTGAYNTAVGDSALQANTTASNNTAVGYQTSYYSTGSTNTAVGTQAGYGDATGSSNTWLGFQAGPNTSTTASGGNNTVVGYRAVYSNTSGNRNTTVGGIALYANTTGSDNAVFGYGAMNLNTTGSNNTALGGQDAIGYPTLYANTTGNYNVAIGAAALRSNTTASGNTALGYQTGYNITTGAQNIFIGYLAGNSATTGSWQTMMGAEAGRNTTTGANNTFIGQGAGYGNTTGSRNTYVGPRSSISYGAGELCTTGNNNTILGGYNGNQGGLDIRTSSNYIVLSDGDGNPRFIGNASGSFIAGKTTYGQVLTAGFEYNNTTNTQYLSACNNGGSSSPSLYVANIAAGSTALVYFYSGSTLVGSITSNGTGTTYGTSSDYRLKENVAPMTGALAKVAQLKPCTYTWKLDGSAGQGFIAHELAEVCPDAVVGQKDAVDEEGKPVYQGIDTSFLVATLTAALQEAHGLIKDLQARVDALESK